MIAPAAPADVPASIVETCHPEAAAIFVHTSSPGDDVDTDVASRQDIIDAIRFHNDTAKALRRKGYIGTAAQSYARIHTLIDDLLYELAALDLEASNGLT